MIRRIQIVLIVICLVMFFLLDLVLLFQKSNWLPLVNFGTDVVATIPVTVQVLILITVLAVILLIGVFTIQLRRDVLITREGEEGRITIVESAIRRYIRQVATDMGAVKSVRTRITPTAEGLVVDLYANVIVSDTLVKIEQAIRAKVREALEQTLGVGGVATINVIVENFEKVPTRTESAGGAAQARPAVGEDFAAPEPPSTHYVRLAQRPEVTDVPGESPAEMPESESGERKY